eukprot:scaffold44847_cov71-Phaeocystis_antarctica.AAC.2
MVHTIQGPSSGSWQVAIPMMQSIRAMAVRANLQAKLRPCEPLIRIRMRNTKGTMYLPCRNDAHVAAGATMNPGAHPLTSHRVVPAGAVEQHAACQPRDSNTENECCPKRPHVWLHERLPGEVSEVEGHQEDMWKIGHAEELRCECRLVSGVCEGARDGVHVSRRRGVRRRFEVRVGASCRRRRRLEVRVVAP